MRPFISDEVLDHHIDAVLRAAGSALRHYSMQKSKDDMRAAMRAAMQEAAGYPQPAPPKAAACSPA